MSGLKATSHLTEVSSVLSEDDVAALISGRLREIWAGALTHYDHQLTEAKGRSVASDCHRDLIDDAKLRLLSATKVQTWVRHSSYAYHRNRNIINTESNSSFSKILITTCLELVGDDVEDLTFLKRLVPSAKELENFCLQERYIYLYIYEISDFSLSLSNICSVFTKLLCISFKKVLTY